jgi:hypothetical protein
MSKTSFAALCGVTVVAVALAVYATAGRPHIESVDTQGARIFPNLVKDVEGLKSVAIRHGGDTVSLDWDGKMWRVRERGNYPADSEKVMSLIVGLAQMAKVEGKTKLPDRYARLEVEDPTAKESKSKQVALIDVNGKEMASLIVGKQQQGLGSKGGGTYVRLANDPQAWLVSGSIVAESNAGDWLKKEVVDIKEPAITRVTVIHPGGEKIVISRAPGAQNFSIENLPAGKQPASFYIADDYGRLLNAMLMEDVVPAAEKPLPKDKTITAVVDGAGGFQVTLEMAEIDGENWVRIHGKAPPADTSAPAAAANAVDLRTDWNAVIAELNSRAEGWVFRVPPFQVAPLKRKMSELLKKPEVPGKSSTAIPSQVEN